LLYCDAVVDRETKVCLSTKFSSSSLGAVYSRFTPFHWAKMHAQSFNLLVWTNCGTAFNCRQCLVLTLSAY